MRKCIVDGEAGILEIFSKAVYSVENGVTMTADTFTILLDNLFVEKVFKHEVHREVFLAYSQVVPEGVKNFDDIIFVIFFMTPEAPIQIV